MKIMLGVPCMDEVKTPFYASCLGLKRPTDAEIHWNIKKCSLVYDARNEITIDAITKGADRILMIDSDMRFSNDLMERMSARLDQGCEIVCGIFFKRVMPTMPVIYSKLEPPTVDPDGRKHMEVVAMEDYPMDSLFEVEGCGMGAVMMTTELVKAVWDTFGAPFQPTDWCGEDMAFCWRVRQLGRKIWCDSSIKVGHTGLMEFNEQTWLSQQAAKKAEKKNE